MNFKKIFGFFLILSTISTIQSSIRQSMLNTLDDYKMAYNENDPSFSDPFLDSRSLEIIFPIHHAAMNTNDPRVLRLLLDKGANINKRSESGKTPLFYALKYNPNTEIALFLLENGANPNALDNFGVNAFAFVDQNEVSRSDRDKEQLTRRMLHHGLNDPNAISAVNNTATAPEPVIQRQILTDEDVCGVCLSSIKELTEAGVQIYKTDCCKQFLCKNCTDAMINSHRSISCPFCRRQPLNVNPLYITVNPETQAFEAETVSLTLRIQ